MLYREYGVTWREYLTVLRAADADVMMEAALGSGDRPAAPKRAAGSAFSRAPNLDGM